MSRRGLLAALIVALAAFVLYRATLLPGVDFGDTGSFQTMVGSPLITPRDGYPLYFAIGTLSVWLTGAEPAHALNLASAIEGAIAAPVQPRRRDDDDAARSQRLARQQRRIVVGRALHPLGAEMLRLDLGQFAEAPDHDQPSTTERSAASVPATGGRCV